MVYLLTFILTAQAYIVGDNDIQKIKDLSSQNPIIEMSKPVGRILGKDLLGFKNYCTGFLISESELMTTFACKRIAKNFLKATVSFNFYEQNNEIENFEVESIVLENPEKNFMIIKLKNSPGKKYGYLTKGLKHTNKMYLIHHSAGDVKQVSDKNCQMFQRIEDFIHHTCDTELSSSGSPLFNADFEVIGMHIGAIGLMNETVNYAIDLSQISF